MTRRMVGLEACFEKCRSVADWRKPKGAPTTWRPKTNWKECDRIDPSHLDGSTFRHVSMEKELQTEREREALLMKAQNTIQTLAGNSSDPRDGIQQAP